MSALAILKKHDPMFRPRAFDRVTIGENWEPVVSILGMVYSGHFYGPDGCDLAYAAREILGRDGDFYLYSCRRRKAATETRR